MNLHNPFQLLVTNVLDDFLRPQIAWQVAALLLSVGLAWCLAGLLQPTLQKRKEQWRIGIGGLSRALFPLLTLIFLMIMRAVLHNWQHINLLLLVTPLFTAMAIIRVSVYLLRNAFVQGGWLDRFEKIVSVTIWSGFALYVTGVLPEVVAGMEAVSIPVGKTSLSLWTLLNAMLTVAVILVVTLWIGRLIESRLIGEMGLDTSFRLAISRFIRAFLVTIGVMLALSLVGIDLTVLSVFGGALGVGLGLGLQRLASNYVSGFVVLLEHSIRIGDMVTIEKHTGIVSRITARYTLVRGLDGTEAIVPNEMLTGTMVMNLALTDNNVRRAINVTVAYATDMEVVLKVMLDVAQAHPRVLNDPAPQALLTEFGDNGIALELGFWIADPEEGTLNVRSELNLALWREFRQRGIEIPYPQREINILTPAPVKT